MTRKITFQTIESLMARTIEVGDCLEWAGRFINRVPVVLHERKTQTVRRVICELKGQKIHKGWVVGPACGNPKCVNERHFVVRNATQHAQAMLRSYDPRAPKLIAKRQSRSPWRKTSDEDVHKMRTDPRPSRVVAQELGVHRSLVSRVRKGDVHRQVNASANPWAGLIK